MKLKHITIHHAMTKLIRHFTKPILLIGFCCLSICLPQDLFANAFTLVASNETALTGETVCIDITTRNFTEIVGTQYDLSFNSAVLQLDTIININSELTNLYYAELSPGIVRIVWANTDVVNTTLIDESLLYQMCFTAIGSTGVITHVSFDTSSPIEIIGGEVGGGTTAFELLPWMLINGSVSIGTSSASTLSLDDGSVVSTTCSTLEGAITIAPSGGQAPYTFLWIGPAGFTSTSMNIANLIPGVYTLIMTDNTGGELIANVYIGDDSEFDVFGDVSHVDCSQSNGAIDLVFIGGSAPYTFIWSNGANTENISGLSLGEYTVSVTDANGCMGTQFFNVNEIEFGQISAIVDDPSCSGGLGSIDLTVTGGLAPYTYSWSDGQATEDISNLASGSYTVTVTDDNACTMMRTYQIGLIANQFNYSYICDPITDLAELIVVDWIGNEEHTYEWSTGEVTVGTQSSSINDLSLGTYTVTITGNSSGCSTVFGPMNVDCSISQSPNNCFMLNANSVSGNNGEQLCMDITTNGFSSIQGIQYTVSWDPTVLAYNGVQNLNLPGLSGLNFGENQTGNGQLLSSWLSSAANGESVADGTVIYQICFDLIGATGTSSAVSFTEDPLVFEVVAAVNTLIGLNASNGTVNIGGLANPLTVTSICTMAPACIDASTGSVDVSVTGGTEPYAFIWYDEFGDILSTTEDLGAVTEEGMYTVVVTDANGEEATAFANVIVNAPEVTVVNVTDVNCNGDLDGSINIAVSGGTFPYSFAWTNGESTEDITNLGADDYEVTVSDQQGCMTVITVTVAQASDLQIIEEEITCPSEAGNDGTVNITVTGGVVPYLYAWSHGVPTEDISDLDDGEYIITVTDVVGCTEVLNFYVGDCVWPGDTDTNGIVNNFDLLNIGLAYGTNGLVRPNASINWTPQEADSWTESTPVSMTNYKHIDTNGEGLIDDNDTLAISQNWGSTHNFIDIGSNLIDLPSDGITVTAPFYVQPDTFIVNTTVGLPVILGDVDNTIEELYGIAFSVTYDPEVVVAGSAKMNFDNSWIGELNNDMITIQRSFHAAGRLDVAIVRTDGMNVVDGLGQIATFFITIEDDLVEPPGFTASLEGMETVFGIENVRIITNIEEEVLVSPTATTSTIEGVSTGVNDFKENFDLQLFPNPVSDQLTINSADAWIEQVTVFDVASREVVTYDYAQAREAILKTNQFGAGTYVVKIQTDKGLAVRRIVVLK